MVRARDRLASLASRSSRTTASPVTRSDIPHEASADRCWLPCAGGHRCLRRRPPGGVAAARGAGHQGRAAQPPHRRRGRRARHPLPAGRDPPVGRPVRLARPGARGPALDTGRPGARRGRGERQPGVGGPRAVLRRDLPRRALPQRALVGRRGRRLLPGRSRRRLVGGGEPAGAVEHRRARADPAAGRARLRGLLLVQPGRLLRRAGRDQQRVGVRARARPRHPHPARRVDPVAERAQRRRLGRSDGRRRPAGRLLRADPPARPARAHLRVRGRRGRPPAGLVVDRPRRRAPARRRWPRRARRPARWRSGWPRPSRCRGWSRPSSHPPGCPPGRGSASAPWSGWRSSPTSWCSVAAPSARARRVRSAAPARPLGRPSPAERVRAGRRP